MKYKNLYIQAPAAPDPSPARARRRLPRPSGSPAGTRPPSGPAAPRGSGGPRRRIHLRRQSSDSGFFLAPVISSVTLGTISVTKVRPGCPSRGMASPSRGDVASSLGVPSRSLCLATSRRAPGGGAVDGHEGPAAAPQEGLPERVQGIPPPAPAFEDRFAPRPWSGASSGSRPHRRGGTGAPAHSWGWDPAASR